MNTLVAVFFIHNVVATLILGLKFASRPGKVFKHFGYAMLLNSVAFAIWSVAVMMRPENLETYVTVGVAFFLVSLIFFLLAGLEKLNPKNRSTLVIAAVIGAALFFYLRTVTYPSVPSFSEQGFFFFNPHPMIQALYIFGLLLIVMPAIRALAGQFSKPYFSELVRYGFLAEVAGGIVLVTSANVGAANETALYLTGWVIGLVYFVLWTTFLFNKKAWS